MAELSQRGAETKERIIRAAAELFHKKGLRATTPEDVIEASGTGKGQFYHYFKSKEGLIHEVLVWHHDRILAGLAPIKYDVASWDDLERWFASHIEMQKEFGMTRGCPFGTAANEITEGEESLREDIKRIFDTIRNRLAMFFIQEKAQQRLRQDADEQRLAAYCIATVQGAMLLGKVARDSAVAEAIIRESLSHLKEYVVKEDGNSDESL